MYYKYVHVYLYKLFSGNFLFFWRIDIVIFSIPKKQLDILDIIKIIIKSNR